MPASISSIKTRIKSVDSTKKITGAMKSVSTVKLNKMSKSTSKNKHYRDALYDATSCLLNSNIDFQSIYLNDNHSKNKLYIVYTSDVGLCGQYNSSIIRFLESNVSKNDYLYLIGISSYNYLKNIGFNIINDTVGSDNVDYYFVASIFEKAKNMFINGDICGVSIIYNSFINSITYKTIEYSLLPFVRNKSNDSKEILLEPNPNQIFDDLIILYLKNEVYYSYLNAKTSEQVARRFAMDNATRNANELIDDLTLEYNKARQGSITQEITEIVSGASAL